MTKAFLLLSGCGSRDGSEIHEATLSLLCLDQHRVSTQCIAPDVPQHRVFDHYHQCVEPSTRQALVEAARIARCQIVALDAVSPADADMLVMPGGLGAATTLCSYLEKGDRATILPQVRTLIEGFYAEKKPIVAICISPVLVALTFAGKTPITLTLGTNPLLADFLRGKGMNPVVCTSDSFVVDPVNRIVSTPAYNENITISTLWKGISGAIGAALSFRP